MYGGRAMQPVIYSTRAHAFTGSGSARSRLTATLLSLGVVALILFMMIEMGLVSLGQSKPADRLVSVQIQARSGGQKSRVVAPTSHQAARAPTLRADPLPTPPHPLWLSHDEFAASDISKLARNSQGSDDAGQSTYGPGEGPGGVQLFNAEWYRKPADAELASYMPERVEPGSWATIACRMVENYHVEDCQELDESPPGSGLARALRRASWQFLVRPPRVNGQAKLGTWVRIRFDFTRRHQD